MAQLATTGKEGALRASYVEKLGESEEQLLGTAREEKDLQAEIKKLTEQVEKKIRSMK